jgi:hypothetical protein
MLDHAEDAIAVAVITVMTDNSAQRHPQPLMPAHRLDAGPRPPGTELTDDRLRAA